MNPSATSSIPAHGGEAGRVGRRDTAGDVLDAVQEIVREDLAPLTVAIDREGLYPEAVLRKLGAAGAFDRHVAHVEPGRHTDLAAAIDAMALVSQECMSTGFMVWCQDTCAWYLENSENRALRERMLPRVASARILAGTGLSNAVKHFAGIERLRLSAEPVAGGFLVNGVLPWVSNLGPEHVFGTVFRVEGSKPRDVMAVIPCDAEGFTLRQSARFTALEGTRTFACQFRNVFIPDESVLADPVGPYLQRVRAGFILLQTGMAVGSVLGCIDVMREVEPTLGHVNCFLDDRPEELEEELEDLRAILPDLLATPFDPSMEYYREVLQLRLTGGELALRAAHSAMLHAGARGYQSNAAAQRKLREAYFVAIVTPAIKHLRKELATLEAAA